MSESKLRDVFRAAYVGCEHDQWVVIYPKESDRAMPAAGYFRGFLSRQHTAYSILPVLIFSSEASIEAFLASDLLNDWNTPWADEEQLAAEGIKNLIREARAVKHPHAVLTLSEVNDAVKYASRDFNPHLTLDEAGYTALMNHEITEWDPGRREPIFLERSTGVYVRLNAFSGVLEPDQELARFAFQREVQSASDEYDLALHDQGSGSCEVIVKASWETTGENVYVQIDEEDAPKLAHLFNVLMIPLTDAVHDPFVSMNHKDRWLKFGGVCDQFEGYVRCIPLPEHVAEDTRYTRIRQPCIAPRTVPLDVQLGVFT